jgi:hypothetical protein
MANNRMYIKNKRTGKKILLAKYYPPSGWSCYYDDLSKRLSELLYENEPAATVYGDNDWIIEYEHKA